MDSSTRSERLRNLTIYNWWRFKAEYQREQAKDKTVEVIQNRRLGGIQFFENQGLNQESSNTPPLSTHHWSLDEAVFAAFDALMVYTAASNMGPTLCARYNYLWFATVTQAYHWVIAALPGAPTGVIDGWDWSLHTPLASPTDRFVWMNHMLVDRMSTFVPGYEGGAYLLAQERAAFGWDDSTQAAEVARIRAAGGWSDWLARWNVWWNARASDGSIAAATTQPTSTDIPNIVTELDVSDTVDPATFPEPTKWTPLKLSMKPAKQGYLTYNWSDVTATAVYNEAAVAAAGSAEFLDPTIPQQDTDRRAEIQAVLDLATPGSGLSDEHKVSAEFWAGGPNTVSPPGMCAWFWRDYMETFNIAHTRGFPTFFYSGLDIAIHTFETSRQTWGLKKAFREARPIQEVRRLWRGQLLTGYDGTAVLGESWVPYQEADFVSPPFGDFPSGHSSFSRSFAVTMAEWFGDALPASAPRERRMLSLLSPVFNGQTQTGSFASFVFPAGASLIQSGTPSIPITLAWTSWSAMAESAGVSRQHGGIHAASAHTGAVALSNALHGELRSAWGIAPASVPVVPE